MKAGCRPETERTTITRPARRAFGDWPTLSLVITLLSVTPVAADIFSRLKLTKMSVTCEDKRACYQLARDSCKGIVKDGVIRKGRYIFSCKRDADDSSNGMFDPKYEFLLR